VTPAEIIKKTVSVFERYPTIKLVYFFGSKATNEAGPLSDYDFAVYADEHDKKKLSDMKIAVLNELSIILETDAIDVVILNTTEQPELKYHIITEGKLIYEKEPFRIVVEPRILNEYFDFRACLLRNNLTKA